MADPTPLQVLQQAITDLCRHFPTDDDMAAAGWSASEIEAACSAYDRARAALASLPAAAVPTQPIDMVLSCPKCGAQHVDAPEFRDGWFNPPHRSHLCHDCGHVWRPADVPTNGVDAVKTKGKADSPLASPAHAAAPSVLPVAWIRRRDMEVLQNFGALADTSLLTKQAMGYDVPLFTSPTGVAAPQSPSYDECKTGNVESAREGAHLKARGDSTVNTIPVRFDVLHAYAEKHNLDYNDLCRWVRTAIAEGSTDVSKVAMDIAKWFVNGDRPDEWKLKEWAERLDRDAITRAYADRSTPEAQRTETGAASPEVLPVSNEPDEKTPVFPPPPSIEGSL